MNNSDDISYAILELFFMAKEKFGDEVESFWFYDGETCPCCSKHKIDAVNLEGKSALSLNSFMYHDMKVLIGYLLCSRCITSLPIMGKKQKLMYKTLEQNLIDGYLKFIKSIAS